MKVLILHRNSFDKIGGVETTLYFLSKELTKLGHEVIILSQKSKSEDTREEITDVAKILRYTRPNIIKVLLPFAPFIIKKRVSNQIASIISVEDPDLVISRDSLLTVIAKEEFRDKKVVYVPPVIIKLYNSKIRKANTIRDKIIFFTRFIQLTIESKYQKKALDYANKIYVFSNNMKSQIDEIYKNRYQGKLHVHYPGIGDKFSYTNKPNYDIFDEFKIPYSHKIVLFVGRVVQEKNLNMLIKAFSKVDKEVTLMIVGDGDDLNNLKKLASDLEVSKKICFVGKRKDVERFYRSATVSVIPSTYEAFGNVISESLACGTPVIGFKNNPPVVRNAVEELITEKFNGFIVRDFSELSLRDSINEAIEMSETKEYIIMRNNCSEFAKKHFNWTKFVRKIIE